jgi:hypothetical protein
MPYAMRMHLKSLNDSQSTVPAAWSTPRIDHLASVRRVEFALHLVHILHHRLPLRKAPTTAFIRTTFGCFFTMPLAPREIYNKNSVTESAPRLTCSPEPSIALRRRFATRTKQTFCYKTIRNSNCFIHAYAFSVAERTHVRTAGGTLCKSSSLQCARTLTGLRASSRWRIAR